MGGATEKTIEQYAEEKVQDKAKKLEPPTQIPNPPKEPETTIEPSKTVPGKVDVVEDGKIVGSQG